MPLQPPTGIAVADLHKAQREQQEQAARNMQDALSTLRPDMIASARALPPIKGGGSVPDVPRTT